MPRTKWTPERVQNWADQSSTPGSDTNSNAGSNANAGSGSGTPPGNTLGNPAIGPMIQNAPIGEYGLHKGVNLKATDPDWREHFHEIMEMFGNIPVIGSLFNAINAGVYLAEGNVAGATQALVSVVMDLVPGGGEVSSSVKVAEDVGKLAETTGVKVTGEEATKAGEQVVGKQMEKQGEKQTGKQEGKQAEKQDEKQEQKQDEKQDEKQPGKDKEEDGGKVVQDKKSACKDSKGVGHPVNPVTGVKFLSGDEDLDFSLPARLPLHWQRSYFSDQMGNGWLGQGWSLPFSLHLERVGDAVWLVDHQGHETRLPTLGQGERRRMGSIGFDVCRETKVRYRFTSTDGSTQYVLASPDVGGDDRAAALLLVGIVDRHGNCMRLVYDDDGLPAMIHDAVGRVLQLQFTSMRLSNGNSVQRLHRVMLETRALVSYEYSSEGDLTRVRDADGQAVREYRYNNHILIEHSQPGALVARYEYDGYGPQGKVLRMENNLGQSWQFRYLAGRTELTNPLGRTECYLFNDQQVVVGRIDAAGNITRTDVDGRGNPVRVTDPAGRSRLATYDAHGNMTSLTDAAGARTEILYHPQWLRPTQITDATGATTRFEYDATGNLSRRTDALGHATSYAYDGSGCLVRITDAHGRPQQFEYDHCGQVVGHTDCSGQTTRYERDDWGHLQSETNAAGETKRYTHDRRGRLLRTERDGAGSEQFTYDLHGRLIEHVDALGARTRWELAPDGLPAARIDALGYRLGYAYDAARRLRLLVNENGAQYRFTYDANGRLVEEQGFDGRLIRYRHDAAGLTQEKIELGTHAPDAVPDEAHPDTLRTTYERDSAGRVTGTTITRAGDGRTERSACRYDAVGRLVAATNDCCRIERSHDALGQLVGETCHVDGQAMKLTYDHDALGNHVCTTLPDGRRINYLFYGPGRVHQINVDGELVCDFERDALHREVSRTQGALVSFYRYDRAGRFVAQRSLIAPTETEAAVSVIARTYGYDAAGNVLEAHDSDGGVRRYRYDALGQMVQAGSETFAFDPAHNLLGKADAAEVMDNRVTQFAHMHYAHDAHGNVVEKANGAGQRVRLDYSLAHEIVGADIISGDDVQRVEYGYDALGRRVCMKDASGATLFLWESNRLLRELHGDRSFDYVYEHNSFVPIAQIESHATRDHGAGRAATILYYHRDQIGMPLDLTGADGRVKWRARYSAWGNTLDARCNEGVHQPLRFQGQYLDTATGLHYNQHRYYDPDTGRFVTQDPIGLMGGVNPYRYAPNPTAWIDPLGLQGVDINIHAPGVNSDVAGRIPNDPNIFSVAGHGYCDYPALQEGSGRPVGAQEMAGRIRNNPKYREGMPVQVYACYAGKGSDCFGQQLANELRSTVYASNGRMRPIDGPQVIENAGAWIGFRPR